jgi:two-component system sensor histidine kinase BaeS
VSLRLRAFALIMLIAVTATAATAWLTLRQASEQVRQSLAADQQQTLQITQELRGYGSSHGTWQGVDAVVARLAHDAGQRIRVETETGQVVADSDLLAGHSSRAVIGAPVSVNARPAVRLTATEPPSLLYRNTVTAIMRYRTAVPYAACLTQARVPFATRLADDGVPEIDVGRDAAAAAAACVRPTPKEADLRADNAAARSCTRKPANEVSPCLVQVFAQRTAAVGPPPLLVYLGAVGESSPPLPIGRTVLLASAVAAMAAVAALLLGRGVLRPVRALIGAAHRLGAGDLSQRVPVTGHDEIAQLARSFNRMADSLQAGEDRQRRMTADIAHELRTPLASLRGLLETLQDGYLQPTPEVLASLHEEVLLQQRIVDDLQDLAAAESGTLTYHWSDVNGPELVHACLAAYRGLGDAAGVALVGDLVEPVWVRGDPDRLRQMVGNLVTNAVRATAAGGRVCLRLSREGQSALIEVCDTGSGIADTDLPHIFDRFWRADAARGRDTGGSGLGLAIARQIVADHGGDISATSAVGVGTTFTVRLPIAAGPAETAPGVVPGGRRSRTG